MFILIWKWEIELKTNKPILVAMVGLVIFSSLNVIFNKDGDLMLVISVEVTLTGILISIWIWNEIRKNKLERQYHE